MVVHFDADAVPTGAEQPRRDTVLAADVPVSRLFHSGCSDEFTVEEGAVRVVENSDLQREVLAGKRFRQVERRPDHIATGDGQAQAGGCTFLPAGIVRFRLKESWIRFAEGVEVLEPVEQLPELSGLLQLVPHHFDPCLFDEGLPGFFTKLPL